jgi:hypothetical protein
MMNETGSPSVSKASLRCGNEANRTLTSFISWPDLSSAARLPSSRRCANRLSIVTSIGVRVGRRTSHCIACSGGQSVCDRAQPSESTCRGNEGNRDGRGSTPPSLQACETPRHDRGRRGCSRWEQAIMPIECLMTPWCAPRVPLGVGASPAGSDKCLSLLTNWPAISIRCTNAAAHCDLSLARDRRRRSSCRRCHFEAIPGWAATWRPFGIADHWPLLPRPVRNVATGIAPYTLRSPH